MKVSKQYFIVKGNGSLDDAVNGNNGIVSLIITITFWSCWSIFSWWLLAKWDILKSMLYALGYFVAFIVSGALCLLIIGYILVPAVYIVMCIHVYKTAKYRNKSSQKRFLINGIFTGEILHYGLPRMLRILAMTKK